MKETIKKILKEEISNGYTKLELLVLQWIFKKQQGARIANNGLSNHMQLLRDVKTLFGLTNKDLARFISLYQDNYTTGGIQQRNDVIRTPLKKYSVDFVYDWSGYQHNTYEVWGGDEDNAWELAKASEDTGEFTESFDEGPVEMSGDRGDHFESDMEDITETIYKELNLLKEERNKKFTDKLLIIIFKSIDKWLQKEGYSVDDLSSDSVIYENVLEIVLGKFAINSQDDEEYIIASFVENFMSAGDWDFLSEVGIKPPTKKNFKVIKMYGMQSTVTDEAEGLAYLPSELLYSEFDGGLNWVTVETEVHDSWDTEYEVYEK